MARLWETLPKTPTPRTLHEVVAVGDDLYVLGGDTEPFGTALASTSVEVYDTVSQTWSIGPDLLTPQGRFGAAVSGGVIYVVGLGGEMQILDPAVGLWESRMPLPWTSAGVRAEAVGGRIFAFGRDVDERRLLSAVYDPIVDGWSNLVPEATGGGRLFGSGVVGSAVYLLQERRSRDRTFLLEYDTVTGSWSRLAPIHSEVFWRGAASDGTRLFTFGGGIRQTGH